eukprot:scaffold1182_cov396-Prasinococcus_capsulatus_cf.AAC.1
MSATPRPGLMALGRVHRGSSARGRWRVPARRSAWVGGCSASSRAPIATAWPARARTSGRSRARGAVAVRDGAGRGTAGGATRATGVASPRLLLNAHVQVARARSSRRCSSRASCGRGARPSRRPLRGCRFRSDAPAVTCAPPARPAQRGARARAQRSADAQVQARPPHRRAHRHARP